MIMIIRPGGSYFANWVFIPDLRYSIKKQTELHAMLLCKILKNAVATLHDGSTEAN